jgi:mono/diheme cytochrome c family protein
MTGCRMLGSIAMLVMLVMLVMLGGCNEGAPAFTEPLTLGGREVSPETLNQGRDLYFKYCVSCHGDSGAGDGPAARSLKFPPRDFRLAQFSFVDADPARAGQLPTHQELVDRIRSGVPERGMPAWTGMREEDLSALADYVKTFSPAWRELPGGAP